MQALVSLFCIGLYYTLASEICYEKAAGLLEFLFIAGVRRLTIKLAWFIFCAVVVLVYNIPCALYFLQANERILEFVDETIVFALFGLYSLAMVALMFTTASLMSTAQRAGLTMLMLMIAGYLGPGWSGIVPNIGFVKEEMCAKWSLLAIRTTDSSSHASSARLCRPAPYKSPSRILSSGKKKRRRCDGTASLKVPWKMTVFTVRFTFL